MVDNNYPSGYGKGHYSKKTFNEAKNYYEIMEQDEAFLTDFDPNEKAEINKTYLKRFAQDFFKNYFRGDSFKIIANGIDNDFKVIGGIGNDQDIIDFEFNARGYIQGYPIVLVADTTYKTQPLSQSDLIPPVSGTRKDTVYLHINLEEIDGTDDSNIVSLEGYSVTTRLKLDYQIVVAEGSLLQERSVDDEGINHYNVKLAEIIRDTTNDITDDMITDLRVTTNTYPIISSTLNQNYTLTNNQTLLIKINGESTAQTITFITDDFIDISNATAREVIDVISRDLKGGMAYLINNGTKFAIQSNNHGVGSSIEITGGTSLIHLGLTNQTVIGKDGNLKPTFFSKQVIQDTINFHDVTDLAEGGTKSYFLNVNKLETTINFVKTYTIPPILLLTPAYNDSNIKVYLKELPNLNNFTVVLENNSIPFHPITVDFNWMAFNYFKQQPFTLDVPNQLDNINVVLI